jgi:hypothetical protein
MKPARQLSAMIQDSRWTKLGLIYKAADHANAWARHSALTPTPFVRRDGTLRVFCGFRDDAGVSRIGYVDVDPTDPSIIVAVSRNPVLDVGRAGCFDDNGMILGDVVRIDQRVYMFYVGFQLVARAKFLAFTGLAISNDDGDSFHRWSEAPFMDRHHGENYIAAVHTVLHEDGLWKFWYGAGDSWRTIDGTPYPSYGVHYLETPDLTRLPNKRVVCLSASDFEYRIGRPRVYRVANGYQMHFTAGNLNGDYFPGIAHSPDGLNWERSDTEFPVSRSDSGWDARHLCYPAIVRLQDKSLMFYNGNDMGRDGFGAAASHDSWWSM